MANTSYIVLIQQTLSNNSGSSTLTIEAPMPESFNFDAGATYEQMLPQGLSNNKVINLAAAINGTKLSVQAFTAQLWSGSSPTELAIEVEFHTETDPVADVRTPIVNLLKMVLPSVSEATGFLSSPGPYIDWAAAGSAVVTTLQTAISSGSSVAGAGISAIENLFQGALAQATGTQLGTPTQPGAMTDSNTQTTNGPNNAAVQAVTQNPGIGSAAYWKSLVKNPITIWIGNYLKFDSVVITGVRQTFVSNFDAQTGLPHSVRVMITFKPLFMLTQGDLDTLFTNPGGTSTPASSGYQFSLPSGAGIPQAGVFGTQTNNSYNFTL